MQINQVQFAQVVETAKTKAANNPRWIAAIEKVADAIINGKWIVTELADGCLITTEKGTTYKANGVCSCRAFEFGQACRHRAAARLIALYNETTGVVVSSRESLIESIKSTWSQKFPADNLADDLMARFRVNYFEALNTGFLQDILAAIA